MRVLMSTSPFSFGCAALSAGLVGRLSFSLGTEGRQDEKVEYKKYSVIMQLVSLRELHLELGRTMH